MKMLYDLDKSLAGDVHEQLRHMVCSLATQLHALTIFVKDPELKQTSIELARTALEYLEEETVPAMLTPGEHGAWTDTGSDVPGGGAS